MIIHIDSGQSADNQYVIQKLSSCDAVMFSGGDQRKLARIFGDSVALQAIRDRYINEDFLSLTLNGLGFSQDAHRIGILGV